MSHAAHLRRSGSVRRHGGQGRTVYAPNGDAGHHTTRRASLVDMMSPVEPPPLNTAGGLKAIAPPDPHHKTILPLPAPPPSPPPPPQGPPAIADRVHIQSFRDGSTCGSLDTCSPPLMWGTVAQGHHLGGGGLLGYNEMPPSPQTNCWPEASGRHGGRRPQW